MASHPGRIAAAALAAWGLRKKPPDRTLDVDRGRVQHRHRRGCAVSEEQTDDRSICPRPPARTRSGLAVASSGAATAAVDVTLQEWAVVPASASVAAGEVSFNAKNAGPKNTHEMVVLKTDLAPDALPTQADGSIDEERAGVTLIGEVEDVPVGSSKTVTLDLASGKYVLLCNIVDGSEVHYKLGMRTAFEVTP